MATVTGQIKHRGCLASGEKRRVCYHTNWSQYRPGVGKFVPSKIDPFLCTHIAYAFAKLDENHLATFEWNDEALYKEAMSLKEQNPDLKVILSVGGWNMGSAPFTKMVASAFNRNDFIQHAIGFLRKYNFDGLDLDWEYPANRGSPASDKEKFGLLVKETRKAFDEEAAKTNNPRLLLAAAVSAGKDKIDTGYMVNTMAKYMDFITLMTYDFHGGWENKLGHNAPLFQRKDETGYETQLNIAWASNYWASRGAPKNKLNIGLALYGRGFVMDNPANHKPGAPAKSPCPAGEYTRENGYLAYYEICKMIKDGTKVYRMEHARVPYLVNGNQWIGYDDPQSLREKVDWVNKEGFGGIAVWALPLDDFNNNCKGGKFPLMNAIVDAMKGVPAAPSEPEIDATEEKEVLDSVPEVEKDNRQSDGTSEFTGCSNKPDGFYKKSCEMYIWCYNGRAFEKRCPPGTVFSSEISQCNHKVLVPEC